jgi:hypothetical protein
LAIAANVLRSLADPLWDTSSAQVRLPSTLRAGIFIETNIAEAVYYMVNGQPLLRERPKADVTSMLTVGMGEAWRHLGAGV